jgi:hypothetical protein
MLYFEHIQLLEEAMESTIPTAIPAIPADLGVEAYTVYLILSLALTVWVGRTLYKSGIRFLIDAMGGDAELAGSLNHLLVVGFYLVNFGFVAMNLRINEALPDAKHVIEALGTQLGWVLMVLGFMHFFNLYIFSKIRRVKLKEKIIVQSRPKLARA